MDGLRRRSHASMNQAQQPGKNILTFLILANLAMWIRTLLEPKATAGAFKFLSMFYGDEFWLILLNLITQPLSIFYWFHSAVALGGIWKSIYNPGQLPDKNEDIQQNIKPDLKPLKSENIENNKRPNFKRLKSCFPVMTNNKSD